MSVQTRELSGARASSAVICPARAEYEGLQADRTDDTPAYLERAFNRGRKVGVLWARIMRDDLIATGRDPAELVVEDKCAWGPPEYGWEGHADLADYGERVVHEIYHAKGGVYREHKGWQAAWYAISKGDEWRAQVDVVDTSSEELASEDEGFSIQSYDVNVPGLRAHVLGLQARVVTAVALGEVNPADKISDTPRHPDCQSCAFMTTCHAGWQPPHPAGIPGLEDVFVALRVTDADRKAQASALKKTEDRRKELIEQIIEVFPDESSSVTSGDVTVKRTVVKPGVSFSLTDAIKAGHSLPAELEAFAKPRKGFDKWEVVE